MQKILDDTKRKQIIAILAIGGTRTLAAQYVGCHPQTITNTAKADAKFAEELNHAETSHEDRLLRTIWDAATKQGNRSATKWLLERMDPDRYRPRKPGIPVEAVKRLMVELAARLAD
jgi:hypothetical protein